MPINTKPVPFTDAGIALVGHSEGVYALLRTPEGVTYIGRSHDLRARLAQHKAGSDGLCTQLSDLFMVEYSSNSVRREKELLQEFVRLRGRLPRCNDRVG